MGKAKEAEDKDLRKEVDMTEHHLPFEEVASKYGVDLNVGLSDAKVAEVKNTYYNFKHHEIFLLLWEQNGKIRNILDRDSHARNVRKAFKKRR